MKLTLRDKAIYWTTTIFLLFALFNPFFKKYDYGAGFPLVILFCVLLIFGGAFLLKEKREKATFENASLFVFGCLLVLSFLFSQTKNIGLSELMAWLSVIFTYQLIAFRRCVWMPMLISALRVFAILAVLLGYVLYFVWPEVRMQGPFFNLLHHSNVWPNAFALFLVMVWPLFLSIKKSGIKIPMLSLIFSAILLTYSRGAMIVLAGQLLLIFIYYFRRINWKNLALVVTTIVSTILLFWGANTLRSVKYEVVNVEERVHFENNEGLTSKQERIDFWLGAVELAKERPLLGWGPSSFRQAYNSIQKTFLGSADHPHNVFLKILMENGAIALISFLVFIFALLYVYLRRFSSLDNDDRSLSYLLFVSIAGAFAHNLIDYNLNFYVNLLLLFLMMGFLRSLLVKKTANNRPILSYILSTLLGLLSIYEGGILFMDASVYDKSFLGHSFFPRNYYLESAESALAYNMPESAITFSNKEIALNALDSQAYYLRGVANCQLENFEECKADYNRAIDLNPMNEWGYYLEYFKLLDEEERKAFTFELSPLMRTYFNYVENNVHFTAYTDNVETAAELVELMAQYLPPDEEASLVEDRDKMLATANRLRAEKNY